MINKAINTTYVSSAAGASTGIVAGCFHRFDYPLAIDAGFVDTGYLTIG